MMVACKSHELCYNKKIRRGWANDEDNANNLECFLCVGLWYPTFSPHCMFSNGRAFMWYLTDVNNLRSRYVDDSSCGVQILELCY